MDAFPNSTLKLRRAEHLIAELERVLEPYHANSPIVTTVNKITRYQEEGRFPDVEGTTEYKALPEMVPPIIGDVVHNLRASLDLMASDLAIANSKTAKDVYFPFAIEEAELGGQIKSKNFHLCGQAAMDLLKTFAPYKGGNKMLRAVHDLDIQDKHRSLMPNPRPRHDLIRFEIVNPEGTRPELQMIADNNPAAELVFDNETGLGDLEIITTLKDLVNLCEGILQSFAHLKTA